MPEPDQLVLLLRLDALLQSWGTNAQGTVKTTLNEPSFSGIVGLIANAMGRTRDQSVEDLAALHFAVRTDVPGQLMRDYQTAGTVGGIIARKEYTTRGGTRAFKDVLEGGKELHKHYLAGASFTAALWGEETVMEAAAAALHRPARALYLGRRACPPAVPVLAGLHRGDPVRMLETYPAHRLADPAAPVKVTVPSVPGDGGGRAQFDHPLDFGTHTRSYLPRYVRSYQVPAPPVEVSA
ncbi:type I-E CRISPR-associated protein Cas5/CasD [uncultured Kocuria sp.]|uniref:type I-E CRISPR-associated protein Cas5/CasD n=1 Tax=uncultured Kocuria sp. TaxID=259305 RepID=UPI00260684F4|nr:type I-E CRISPR-associated protein Cas5/CasD [uncultured Kocuria sp.]